MNNEDENKKDPYYPKKVIFIACEECNFSLIFSYDNRSFFYCRKHKLAANLPDNSKTPLCPECNLPAKRYDLAEEDNFCPVCQHGYLSVIYGDKQFSKEEAAALYRRAQQAEK